MEFRRGLFRSARRPRSDPCRIEARAAWSCLPDRDLAKDRLGRGGALFRKRVISAPKNIGEGERSVEQCPDRQQCPLVHPVTRAPQLDMTRHRLLANAQDPADLPVPLAARRPQRSEEHTSELQSLMRISYAVFCLKKK